MKRQVKASVGRSVGYSVSESVGEGSSSATAATGFIDVYPGAIAAYSTARRLRDAYTGALFRVRRDSDNAEQDIGFVAGTGLVDESALTTFVGASSGLITTLYDQGTTGLDLVQATAGSQPVIVSVGAVSTLGTNLRPAMEFNGTKTINRAATNLTAVTEMTVMSAIRRTSDAASGFYASFGDVAGDQGTWNAGSPAGAATNISFRVRANGSTNPTLTATTSAAPVDLVILGDFDFSASTKRLRFNANALVSNAVSVSATIDFALSTQNLRLGGGAAGASFNGMVAEIVLWNNATIAGTTDADSNLMTFYGIP